MVFSLFSALFCTDEFITVSSPLYEKARKKTKNALVETTLFFLFGAPNSVLGPSVIFTSPSDQLDFKDSNYLNALTNLNYTLYFDVYEQLMIMVQ